MRWTRLFSSRRSCRRCRAGSRPADTATLRGTVTDPTAARDRRRATVTVKNEDTGFTRTMTTNADGIYVFAGPARRHLHASTVEFAGFKTIEQTRVVLNVADVRGPTFSSRPARSRETVSVEADALAVKTVGGEVSGLITGEQVRELPLNGRNFLQLAMLMPGVSAPDVLNVKDKGLLGGSDLSVSGSAVDREPVDRGRREQQRRRLEPHDPGLPVGRRDRGVQDPPQQLRRGVRPGGRRARSTS